MPKYSFIIPAFNEEALIAQTIAALKENAREFSGGFEIIVANDASSDRTPEIARQLGARVIDVHKRQIGAVRNAGASIATGDVFVFVDADTIVPRETLLEVERLLVDPEIVAGGARLTFDQTPPFWARLFAKIFLSIYFAARLAAGGFIFARRDAFTKAGGFDEKYFAGEEIHLSKALKRIGKLCIIGHPVITSGRKFRTKRFRDHVAFFKHMAKTGKKGLESREGLDIWYDGHREK